MSQQTTTLTFAGRLNPASFDAFARHRAARLSVELTLIKSDASKACMRVAGQRDLVDAFEMALSLGPSDCVVTNVERAASPDRADFDQNKDMNP